MSKQKVQNEKELGLIRSTRLEKREQKATSQFGEEAKNDVAHAQEASSGGAICPLFPRASNSGGTQAEGQVALLPLFLELPNLGAAQAQARGGNAQAQVSFTQMLTVICSYKVSLQI
jgi:hypothetical protein